MLSLFFGGASSPWGLSVRFRTNIYISLPRPRAKISLGWRIGGACWLVFPTPSHKSFRLCSLWELLPARGRQLSDFFLFPFSCFFNTVLCHPLCQLVQQKSSAKICEHWLLDPVVRRELSKGEISTSAQIIHTLKEERAERAPNFN